MKPAFIAMMAATFVLGMGFIGVIFILAKLATGEVRRATQWGRAESNSESCLGASSRKKTVRVPLAHTMT